MGAKMKKAIWLCAMAMAVIILLFSPLVGFELIFFIDAIGIDMFAMLLEAQLLVAIGLIMSKTKHTVRYVHEWLMLRDTNYFIPGKEIIRAYPPMIIHGFPELLALPIIAAMIIGKALQFA